MFREDTCTMTLECEEIARGAVIERYLAGRLPEDDSVALEAHYLTCARCQTDLGLAAAIRKSLAEAPGETEEASSSARAGAPSVPARTLPSARWFTIGSIGAVGLAAGITGLLLVRSPLSSPEPSVHRDEGVAAEAVPVAVAPVGPVTSVTEFRWTPLPAADLYRLTLYDSEGTVLWEGETRSSVASVPPGLSIATGTLYLWEVEARVGFDRWVASELVRFRVGTNGGDAR